MGVAHLRFESIFIKDQGWRMDDGDHLVADVKFDYSAGGTDQLRRIARVQGSAGGTYETDPLEVVLPDLQGPTSYQAIRDEVEQYYRDAIGPGGWAIDLADGASLRFINGRTEEVKWVAVPVEGEADPTLSAAECAEPRMALGTDSAFDLLPVVHDVAFVDQTVYLDGRSFRDCTFARCQIVIVFGSFKLWNAPGSGVAIRFDDCSFLLEGPAGNVLEFVRPLYGFDWDDAKAEVRRGGTGETRVP